MRSPFALKKKGSGRFDTACRADFSDIEIIPINYG